MPGGYGTRDTDWGTAGTTSPVGSYSAPGGNVRDEGSNRVADAVNAFQSAPPQLSFTPDLQNQAQLAIAQENIHKGIGKYAGQFPEYDVEQPMGTGFGSVFGASSGSTASSETVQDSLNFMIDQNVKEIINNQTGGDPNTIYNPTSSDINNAINAAYSNFYPQINQMTLEEFIAAGGTEGDYIAANAAMIPGSANQMPVPSGHISMGDQYYNNWATSQPSFDESFAMDPFYDEWDSQYGGGGEEMERFLGGRWASDPTPTEMVSMGEMEPIFGEELDPGRGASWLYLTGVPHFSDTTRYNYP